MAEHIYPKKIRNNLYYYYQRTYREKIDPSDSGKTKGSGKSRVKTESVYLGSAASILKRLREAEADYLRGQRVFARDGFQGIPPDSRPGRCVSSGGHLAHRRAGDCRRASIPD